jgi:hypothetical protein
VAKVKESYTGQYLKEYLKPAAQRIAPPQKKTRRDAAA